MKKQPLSSARFSSEWPILKTYSGAHLRRVALPLGGIGTGTVSLGGRGDLRDWEVMNRPAKGFHPGLDRQPGAFFAVWLRESDGRTHTRLLEGPIDPEDYEGASGCTVANHSLPRFRRADFAAAYPFGQVALSDPDLPVEARLEAFNPLVPADAETSGVPVAFFRWVLRNRTGRPLRGAICANLPNFIGADPAAPQPYAPLRRNINRVRVDGRVKGVLLATERPETDLPEWGTMALAVVGGKGVTVRTDWTRASWGNALLDFWDDFSADGRLEERGGSEPAPEGHPPKASLATAFELAPRAETRIEFVVAWHFPNRMTWSPRPAAGSTGGSAPAPACDCGESDRIGNYYTTRFEDAWAVVRAAARRGAKWEAESLRFVRFFLGSDLPAAVKEAALFNVSTLRTQTTFRLPSGHLMGWEGCCDRGGCCHGSCTHVWNYDLATPLLFGALARTMRDVEFGHATDERGLMSFRVHLPLSRAREWRYAAADGQMGCLIKLYREWRLSGDSEWLRRLWPAARRALEFCWVPGGWDADRDGLMEGCQHNTMDVEYYGPNPQMTGLYLGALRAGEEMARAVGDPEFAATCRDLFTKGREAMGRLLFNGDYYEHEIRPPAPGAEIAEGLRVGMGAAVPAEPDLQLGAGCLIDQLVGQYLAHAAGLGYLQEPARVRTTLRSILKHNFKRSFHDHFNHLRTYVLGDEQAVLMATYPRGRRPRNPFPYYNEVMTGFEYTLAVGLIQEGMEREGLTCIRAIRDRYDGRRRSPFDEAECGHHYARAMASWGAVPALIGFDYSAIEGAMTAADRPGRWFWSTGDAWGDLEIRRRGSARTVRLRVGGGRVGVRRLRIAGVGEAAVRAGLLRAGRTIAVTIRAPTRSVR